MPKQYPALLCVLSSLFSFGQQAESVAEPANEYIETYEEHVKARLGFSNSFNSFHVQDEPDNLDFTVSPNQRLRTTLTLMYKFIEVDLGYTPQFIRFNKDDNSNGKTKYAALGTRLYFGRWMQNLQYAKTKGYYVDKDDIGVTENILFPDFRVQKIGGSTSYIFNPNFSYRAIFLQSEWQKKSAGSFIPGISYYYTQIKNGGPEKDDIIDIAAGPAYYYNWVIAQKFLLSAGAYAGVGYHNTTTKYEDGTPNETVDGLSVETQFRFTLGYNAKSFYTGLTSSVNSFYYNNDPKVHVQDQQQFLEFYIGYRFMAPKKVKEIVDKAQLPKNK